MQVPVQLKWEATGDQA